MKFTLLIILVIIISSCVNKNELTQNEMQYLKLEHKVLKNDNLEWNPTETDIRNAKLAIANYFDGDGLKTNIYINKLKSSLNRYVIQFLGVNKRGSKVLLCNLIPKELSFEWESKYIKSEKDGPMIIEVDYNLEGNSCYGFSVEGSN